MLVGAGGGGGRPDVAVVVDLGLLAGDDGGAVLQVGAGGGLGHARPTTHHAKQFSPESTK